jgi:hypothetical protein
MGSLRSKNNYTVPTQYPTPAPAYPHVMKFSGKADFFHEKTNQEQVSRNSIYETNLTGNLVRSVDTKFCDTKFLKKNYLRMSWDLYIISQNTCEIPQPILAKLNRK